ncbi:helix-turn-helix transcriptional regulator [Hymenobacter sp. YC55]|uniref:helix-turn-helix domain-containing protein n=1 Tax=Hymenobacter sp. YC55 TaxID=3034019 RepID=UPI0023F827E4|nr:helix-turn-helix transcriptional regulator [Hymenobacter sp. YC55]MDF7814027.1 helix-turn-helix transcriptional regulator [Hymenobacter sp. YC55]
MVQLTANSPVRWTTQDLKLKGFKIYAVDQPCLTKPRFTRRDCYKVILLTTKARLHYGHQSWELDGTYLLFFNPHIPYSMEMVGTFRHGFISLFTEEFIASLDRSESLQQSPLFKIGSAPVCRLPEAQVPFMTSIFEKMLAEQEADYPFKDELIRNYLQLAIHEALHLQPSATFLSHHNAAARLAARFLETLEQQFPVENPEHTLALKTAQEFADRLAVHVNHLNKAVKEVTGKPTSAHITHRITDEAKALLHHTDWSVAEIAYCLGFAYSTYFNNFFKKQTGFTPLAYRRAA